MNQLHRNHYIINILLKIIPNFVNGAGNNQFKTLSQIQTHHEHIRDGLEELHELSEAIVAEFALATKVVVVGGNELAEGHSAMRLMT